MTISSPSIYALALLVGAVGICSLPASEPSIRFGHQNYVEYRAGDLPILISVPHGGTLKPDSMPDRKKGILVADEFSLEYANEVYEIIRKKTGRKPHMVISHLHRVKLDPNRDIHEATENSPSAERVWNDFHTMLDAACSTVAAVHGSGHLWDLHSRRSDVPHVDVGNRVNKKRLVLTDVEIDTSFQMDTMFSLRSLAKRHNKKISEMIRGPLSFGAILEKQGLAAMPSPSRPFPDSATIFYPGAYDVIRHGSSAGNGGTVDATQIEVCVVRMRESAYRKAFPGALASAMLEYMRVWYGMKEGGN